MLEKALALHRSGQLAEAAALYREILRQNPRHADALHLLGVVQTQRKNLSAAVDLFDRALAIKPDHAEALNNRRPGIRLISLQKNHGLDQLTNLSADVAIENLGDEFDSGPDAFIDTAAVMRSLDLIITSDTSIAHLAGALGRPTWVALQHVPDWRWLLDRTDSPWYPTMRLFRQQARGDWAGAFRNMAAELDAILSRI